MFNESSFSWESLHLLIFHPMMENPCATGYYPSKSTRANPCFDSLAKNAHGHLTLSQPGSGLSDCATHPPTHMYWNSPWDDGIKDDQPPSVGDAPTRQLDAKSHGTTPRTSPSIGAIMASESFKKLSHGRRIQISKYTNDLLPTK
jgi:hypothetical protein